MDKRLPIFGLSALFFLGLASFYVTSNDTPEQSQGYRHLVETTQIERQSEYLVTRKFVGEVSARQTLSLGFELAGSIEQLNVDDGDHVTQGQTLAKLDTRILNADKKRISAQLDEVAASLELNHLNQKRQQTLKSKNLAVEQRLDELTAEQAQLSARAQQLTASLNQLDTQLDKARLKAPFDGQITFRHQDTGAVINAGQPVLDLIENTVLEARVGIPETSIAQLAIDQELQVITQNGQTFTATVKGLVPTLDNVTRSRVVRLVLPSQAPTISGEAIYVLIDESRKQAGAWLPVEALSEGIRGTWNVLAVEGTQGTTVLRKHLVTPLYFSEQRVFVRTELATGQQVVAQGTHRLTAGIPVRVKEMR